MCQRLGVGKRVKHLDIQILWVQQLVKAGLLTVVKVSTAMNFADPLTKHMSQIAMARFCALMHMTFPNSAMYEELDAFEAPEVYSPETYEDFGDEWNDDFNDQLYAIIRALPQG